MSCCGSCTADDLKVFPEEEIGIWVSTTQPGGVFQKTEDYLVASNPDAYFNDFGLLATPTAFQLNRNAWRCVKEPDFSSANMILLYQVDFETMDETGDKPTNWQPNFFRPEIWVNNKRELLGLKGSTNNLADLSIGVPIDYCRPGPIYLQNNPRIEVYGDIKRKLDSGLYQSYPGICTIRFRYNV